MSGETAGNCKTNLKVDTKKKKKEKINDNLLAPDFNSNIID